MNEAGKLRLVRAGTEDAELIWRMQVRSFAALLERYQDADTNPAAEPVDKVMMRLRQPYTYFYLIMEADVPVGAIRIVDKREEGIRKRVSPLFVLPEHCGRGIAQWAMAEAERLHGSGSWALDTIAQEAGNRHLYEKMGYRATGETRVVNDRLTLIFYEKD